MKRPTPSTREPTADVRAQLAAVADKRHPKDAAFMARGTPVPAGSRGHVVARPEGIMVTTNAKKAASFARGGNSDNKMAKLLDLPQSKGQVKAAGANQARVVQAQTRRGAVVTETLASPGGTPKAQKTLAKHVPPGGKLVTTTPLMAQVRRARNT